MIGRRDFTRLIAGFFLLPTFIVSFFTSTVQAVPDIIFYSTNDITHYDPTACDPQGGSDGGEDTESGANVKTVLEYLTKKGLTLAQAAGIAGNMKQESGFDPRIIEGGETAPNNYNPVDGTGFGLVQWTFDSRQIPLEKMAEETGFDITNMTLQLNYVWFELTGDWKSTLKKLISTTNPVDAAIVVHDTYEISADSDEKVRRVRGGAAQEYYDKFRSEIKDGVGVNIDGEAQTPITSGGGTGGACGQGAASDFSADGFTVYNQCDPRWANIPFGTSGKTACSSGCGPTAMAAAITALTGKAVTPKDTVPYASSKGMYRDGQGSVHTLPTVIGGKFGVSAKAIAANVSAVNDALKNNSLVIMAGTGADPFTSAGHYILVRGITANGKWKIADSNFQGDGEENSKKEWDPKFIMDIVSRTSAGSVYSVSK